MHASATPGRPASTYAVASWIWIRLLGVVFLIAFWSLEVQLPGLFGRQGVLPAAEFMSRAHAVLHGLDRFRLLPTLAWFASGDGALRAMCVSGMLLAALVAAGIAPAVLLPVLWLLYLSLSIVGREFLSYQWDALLLEAALITAFVAPWTWRHRLSSGPDPSRLGRGLLLWLLVRLMAGSGAVKLASGDPTWRGLTALSFHFWTQPIPTPLAWYANLAPRSLLSAATALTLAIELAAPLLVVAPRRWLAAGCAALAGLQAVIALTGNYAFFNLLAAGLCVWMLDDAQLAGLVPARARAAIAARDGTAARGRSRRVRHALLAAFAMVTVPVSLVNAAGGAGAGVDLPLVSDVAAWLGPFRSVNAYGLFAVMTTSRPQIVVEGSSDGEAWAAYEFKFQPADVRDPPPWVAPHQPRLDWQLWFAALSRYEDEPWFEAFMTRLLQGSPPVLALLRRDPFSGRAPTYVRAQLYQYRFTDRETRARTGAWWTREFVGPYSPVLSLVGGRGGGGH